jgi:hypothetical protein
MILGEICPQRRLPHPAGKGRAASVRASSAILPEQEPSHFRIPQKTLLAALETLQPRPQLCRLVVNLRMDILVAKHDEYIVEPRADGRWSVKKPHAERASRVEDTQEKALRETRSMAPEGDIKLKGRNGKFRNV